MEEQTLKLQIPNFTPTEKLAYIAGIFDGEGCVTCQRNAGNPYPVVTITSLNDTVLYLFQQEFGGHVNHYKQPANDKMCGRWAVSGLGIVKFLEQIKPYSIIKKGPIEFGLALANTLGVKGQHITPQNLLLRERLWEKLQEVNGK